MFAYMALTTVVFSLDIAVFNMAASRDTILHYVSGNPYF